MSDVNSIHPTSVARAAYQSVVGVLSGAEYRLLGFILATLAGIFVNQAVRHQAVDWGQFFPVVGVSLELALIGAFLRKTGRFPRLAMGTVGLGLYVCFSSCSAIFIFTLFPFVNPMIDQQLIALDAAFGFSWVGFVEYVASYPKIGLALRHVYLTILPQVGFLIVLLSYLRREVVLHRFLTVGFVGMILTDTLWWLFPSVGPAAYGMVSVDAQTNILLVANAAYGAEMRSLATEGLALITPQRITGVVAFPSFHIVLTCLVLWFARGTLAFVPLVILNIPMPVATVVHGGHHLVDLFGGIIVFVVSLKVGNWLIPEISPANTASEPY